jgi:hypothetical protein
VTRTLLGGYPGVSYPKQWSDGNGITLNLGCEEAHVACHPFYAKDFIAKKLQNQGSG